MWARNGSLEVRITSDILPHAGVEPACPQQPHECAPGGVLLGFYNILLKAVLKNAWFTNGCTEFLLHILYPVAPL